MAGIVIINGPFGSGKTTVAGALNDSLKLSYPGLSITKVADGPHLVDQIRERAHGAAGDGISASHYHPWVKRPEEGHHHLGRESSSHFPFTVIRTGVTDAMIRGFLLELSHESKRLDLNIIIAELGTGIPDRKISQVQLTTTRFLQIAREERLWDMLKQRIMGVATIDTAWETRLSRDSQRPQLADGLNRSWGMVLAGMNITREPDFGPWKKELADGKIICINNNGPMDIRQLDPVLALVEKNLTLEGPPRMTKEG